MLSAQLWFCARSHAIVHCSCNYLPPPPQNALEEFLSTAELAGTDFTAQRLNMTIVTETRNEALPSKEEREYVRTLPNVGSVLFDSCCCCCWPLACLLLPKTVTPSLPPPPNLPFCFVRLCLGVCLCLCLGALGGYRLPPLRFFPSLCFCRVRATAKAQRENRRKLRVPRRPEWTRDMPKEELHLRERER